MRVLHLRSTYTYAGPEAVFLNFAPVLQQRGVQLKLIANYRRGPSEPAVPRFVTRATQLGISAEAWQDTALFSPRAILRLERELRQGNFDLIHTHDPKSEVYGWIAAKLARIPCVATVHGYDIAMWKSRLYRAADLQALRRFPQIIAVSRALRDELIGAGIPGRSIAVVYNCLDVNRFSEGAEGRRAGWRARNGLGAEPLVITVGRLYPQKQTEVFIQAAARIHANRPEVRFWVVGEGPCRRILEQQARNLGLAGIVKFLGAQEDVAGIMAASDLFAMSSRREGFGLVLLEALALSKPVVATRAGGIPEVIQEGKTGFLVAPNQPQALAERIEELLRNPELGAEVGRAARLHVVETFTPEATAEGILQVYREVYGRTATRAQVGPSNPTSAGST